jgi:energy-converting hydrogenase Eha subunit A
MPQITVKIGTRERLEPSILKSTPLGALSTEAVVHIGATAIQGTAAALRALAGVCEEAASMAEAYDLDPAAYNERGEAIE